MSAGAGLAGPALTGPVEGPPDNPYVGPRPFEVGEPLFGRDREVRELLDLLIAERIVLLYSPSGAGKTSLIRAGLIPQLRVEGLPVLSGDRLVRVSAEPSPAAAGADGRPPNRYVLSALLALEEGLPPDQQTPLSDLVALDLPAYLDRQSAAANADAEVLLFDQFEEVLSLDPIDVPAKEAFFTQLGLALRNRRRMALFALREDYLAGLDPYVRLVPTRLGTRYRLDLLGPEAARQAIQEPARAAGAAFTDGAARKLVDDLRTVLVQELDGTARERLGPHVEPVQLQVVCRRLWASLAPGSGGITEEHVRATGDVDSALAAYYAERVEAIGRLRVGGAGERAIRHWFNDHLITEHGIRGQVLQGPQRSQGLPNEAIRLLADAHLVRAERRRGATWYELAHDRLIKPVRGDNASWFRERLSLLQRRAQQWDTDGRHDGLLLRDQDVAAAQRWAHDHETELTEAERDLLAASLVAQRAAERERRTNRLIRALALGATALSLVALAFLAWATVERGRAEAESRRAALEARVSTSRELAAAAVGNLSIDPQRSVLLALQAVAVADSPEAVDALQRVVQASQEQLTLAGHGREVYGVAFSPDGSRLATASLDGTAKLWDAGTGRALATLGGHRGEVTAVAFSPDGAALATAGVDRTAKLWDVATGQEVRALTAGHTREVYGVAFSPDGSRLATASLDGTAKLWDVASGGALATLAGHTREVYGVAFSPDGARLATASLDGTARVWDAASGGALLTLNGHTQEVTAVAFSPDGTHLATASLDKTARLWDATTGREVRTLRGHTNSVFGVGFSPEGARLATAGGDGTVRVWDVASGGALATLAGHTNPVYGVAFSPDGTRVASASWDTTARVWNAPWPHTAEVNSVAFSPDGARLATAGADATAVVWDAASGQRLRTLTGHEREVYRAVFGPDGARLATAGADGTARVWDAASGRLMVTLDGHAGEVYGVAYSPDGARLATAGADGTARVWDAASGQEVLSLKGHIGQVYDVAFSPDSKRLTTTGWDRTVRVWDAAAGTEVFAIPLVGHEGEIYRVAFSPDGARLATASLDRTVRVWDAASGKEVRTLTHTNAASSVAFSPDGTHLATASWDRTAKLWDATSGQELRTLAGPAAEVSDVAFSPDGKRLAAAAWDRTVRVYILDVPELMALARRRVTRALTLAECRRYLHQENCPPAP